MPKIKRRYAVDVETVFHVDAFDAASARRKVAEVLRRQFEIAPDVRLGGLGACFDIVQIGGPAHRGRAQDDESEATNGANGRPSERTPPPLNPGKTVPAVGTLSTDGTKCGAPSRDA